MILAFLFAQEKKVCYITQEDRHLSSAVEQCFRKAKVPGSNPGGGSQN